VSTHRQEGDEGEERETFSREYLNTLDSQAMAMSRAEIG